MFFLEVIFVETSIQQTESFFEENKIEEKRKEIKVVVLEEEEEEEEEIEEDKVPSSEPIEQGTHSEFV